MAEPYGILQNSQTAAVILKAAGVLPNSDIGIEGFAFDYAGITYWILQRGIRFASGDANSPDGWHIVYAPTLQEIESGKVPKPFDFSEAFQAVINAALIIAGVYFCGKVLDISKR
jgi:hypothetical protein